MKHLNTRDAAAHLGVSTSFLAKARVYGNGPVYRKLGRKVVYRVAALEAWAEQRERHCTAEDAA